MNKILIRVLSRGHRWALEAPGFAWLSRLCDRAMGALGG